VADVFGSFGQDRSLVKLVGRPRTIQMLSVIVFFMSSVRSCSTIVQKSTEGLER
jgi:hypothetical protein